MRTRMLLFLSVLFFNFDYSFASAPLDNTLAPNADEEVSNVFRDMGVVQRRAMRKEDRFVFSGYGSLDFSDGPYSNYSFHINPGYAFRDDLEVYANIVPFYIVNKRSIVDKVSSLTLASGQRASITAATPKYQFGVEVMWAPLYGKDSLGISKVVRSDTFLKLGASQIQYDTTTGLNFKLGVGKTFFLGKSAGLRFCVDYGYIQSIVDEVKSFKGLMLLEVGMVYYL